MNTMNSIVLEFYRNVSKEAQALKKKTGKNLLTAQDIQSAVKITVPGELCKHAVAQAATAITKYKASTQVKNWEKQFCHFLPSMKKYILFKRIDRKLNFIKQNIFLHWR